MSQQEACPGRRERKKQATHRAIREAALELALERGVDGLTVEDITEAADVSYRTFFNYFSCKEDALVGDSQEATEDLRELIRARPEGESPVQVLRAVLRDSERLRTAHGERGHAQARQRLIFENPALLPRQLAKYAAVERGMAEGVAERMGVDVDADVRPALLAAVAATVVRVAMQRWTNDDSRSADDLIEEAFDYLEHKL